MDKDQKKIYEFIKKHSLGVVSTVTSDFLPEAAVVGISENENLELIFGTSRKSRKYYNLLRNPRVAVVIGWESGKTLQYEGEAVELKDDTGRQAAIETHLAKIPSAAKYLSDADEAVFKIIPKWIRYSDVSFDPWEVIELKF